MKIFSLTFAVYFIFGVSVLFAGLLEASCEKQNSSYGKLLKELDRSCKTFEDCNAFSVSWSGCELIVLSKDQPVSRLIKEREKLWKQCKYKMAPCGIQPVVSLCIAGRCGSRADLKDYESIDKLFQFDVGDRPLMNTEVRLQKVVDPFCRGKDCAKTLRTFTTDASGRLSWKFSEIIELVFGVGGNLGSWLLQGFPRSEQVYFSTDGQKFEIPWYDLFRDPEAVVALRPK